MTKDQMANNAQNKPLCHKASLHTYTRWHGAWHCRALTGPGPQIQWPKTKELTTTSNNKTSIYCIFISLFGPI